MRRAAKSRASRTGSRRWRSNARADPRDKRFLKARPTPGFVFLRIVSKQRSSAPSSRSTKLFACATAAIRRLRVDDGRRQSARILLPATGFCVAPASLVVNGRRDRLRFPEAMLTFSDRLQSSSSLFDPTALGAIHSRLPLLMRAPFFSSRPFENKSFVRFFATTDRTIRAHRITNGLRVTLHGRAEKYASR